MPLPGHNGSNSSCVPTTGHHTEVTSVELDHILHLPNGVRISDGAAIASIKVRNSLRTGFHLPHAAQLVLTLGGSDPVNSKTSLDVINNPEVFSSLLDLDNIHEPCWELRVSPGLAINLDKSLLQ